ncbi:MAG: DUF302 domain-containing protein [candidate division Zixibacteria bacterium]|nr:DUF302 domain-containing protein [candidate division Zixibacteria bacterium]
MENMGFVIETSKSMDDVSSGLEKATSEHGFTILAVHDVHKTLTEKGFDSQPLKIYEVCNAEFAHQALASDVNVAMFMPCKIVVRTGDNAGTKMTLVRPSMISAMMPESGLEKMAQEVEERLIGIMDAVK